MWPGRKEWKKGERPLVPFSKTRAYQGVTALGLEGGRLLSSFLDTVGRWGKRGKRGRKKNSLLHSRRKQRERRKKGSGKG